MLAVTNGQWVSSLLPSAYRQLAALGLQLSFDDGPLPRVPARAATLTVAGSFIDEGAPFPVRQLAFAASQQLKPKKLAVATVFSREVALASQPNVEAVLRDEIVADTSVAVDSVLLSATAANTAAPAGLRSGVAGLTATASGTTNERMVADVRQLLAAIAPAASPVLIVNSQQALTIASVYQSESPALIVSPNVPAGTVTAVDAGAFVTASRLPSFQISTDPVIHLEDTSPLHIATGAQGSGVVAAPSRSMFQTDSMALKMTWRIDWLLRRSGAVAWLSGATW